MTKLIFAVLAFALCASAQTFNFAADKEPVISLDGQWRFHTGDDPHWADPQFNDSHWALVRSDRDWGQQGYKGYSGMAWYRFQVKAVGTQPLAVILPPISTSYQVFANGRLVGGFGKMPPRAIRYLPFPSLFNIQQRRSSDITICIRVWHDSVIAASYGGGPIMGGGLLGQRTDLQRRYTFGLYERIWSVSNDLILGILWTVAGLGSLALFLYRRSEPEYLWFAIMQCANAAMTLPLMLYKVKSVPVNPLAVSFYGLPGLSAAATIFFYCAVFKQQRNALFWVFALSHISYIIGALPLTLGWPNPYSPVLVLPYLLTLLAYGWIIVSGLGAIRRGLPDARLFLIPICLQFGATAVLAITRFQPTWIPGALQRYDLFLLPVDFDDIPSIVLLGVVVAILVGRFARTRQSEEGYALELEAARNVQQVLVPEATPAIPGFAIKTIYQPAKEVGGDFFQIIPQENRVLLAIGDVSGKGLPAAMTVSLIVGALRMAVEQTSSPAAILEGLNRRLVGRGSGFTTCLVLTLHTDGSGRIANAGHLAPYRNGTEMEFVAHLPLGLSMETQFTETMLSLKLGDRLTFLSDGVVEARNKDGALFGFDRTRLSSIEPAEEIVAAAKLFGQEDDITVLTLQYVGTLSPEETSECGR